MSKRKGYGEGKGEGDTGFKKGTELRNCLREQTEPSDPIPEKKWKKKALILEIRSHNDGRRGRGSNDMKGRGGGNSLIRPKVHEKGGKDTRVKNEKTYGGIGKSWESIDKN